MFFGTRIGVDSVCPDFVVSFSIAFELVGLDIFRILSLVDFVIIWDEEYSGSFALIFDRHSSLVILNNFLFRRIFVTKMKKIEMNPCR